jgi:hypothetical protein
MLQWTCAAGPWQMFIRGIYGFDDVAVERVRPDKIPYFSGQPEERGFLSAAVCTIVAVSGKIAGFIVVKPTWPCVCRSLASCCKNRFQAFGVASDILHNAPSFATFDCDVCV